MLLKESESQQTISEEIKIEYECDFEEELYEDIYKNDSLAQSNIDCAVDDEQFEDICCYEKEEVSNDNIETNINTLKSSIVDKLYFLNKINTKYLISTGAGTIILIAGISLLMYINLRENANVIWLKPFTNEIIQTQSNLPPNIPDETDVKKQYEESLGNSRVFKYKVNEGDSLTYISKLFYNDSEKFWIIQKYNNITDPHKIKEGQVLLIP